MELLQFVLIFLGVIGSIHALNCQTGWEGPSPGGKCYQINARNGLVWNDAVKACGEVGGELASIENQAESDFITNRIIPSAKDWLVTGGHRQPAGTGPWVWADGSAMTFSNPGTPPLNSAVAADQLNYLYLYAHPVQKGTASYGKTFLDRPVTHQVLCQKKAALDSCPPRNNNCGGCGGCCGCCGGCGC